jgi:hypothetical protein
MKSEIQNPKFKMNEAKNIIQNISCNVNLRHATFEIQDPICKIQPPVTKINNLESWNSEIAPL